MSHFYQEIDPKVQDAIELALRRGNNFTKTFWVITSAVPRQLKGTEHLAMKLKADKHYKYREVILSFNNSFYIISMIYELFSGCYCHIVV